MPFYIHYSEDYLAHSGIKGMKWGVRRWQNYDGSLTDAGRIHYGYGPKRQSQKKYGGLFTKKTPEEKNAASARKLQSKIDSRKRKISENEDTILENSKLAGEYARKAADARVVAEGYQRKSDEYTRTNRWLEIENQAHDKKIQKLEKELEKLQGKKMSDVKADPDLFDEEAKKLSGKDFDGDTRHPKSYDPERSETTLKDYAKSGKAEKNMKSEFDKMRNNATSDEDKDRKVASWEKARDKDLWNLDFLEAVQNSKALHDGDTTTLLREYAKFLDHPMEYMENDEAGKLKGA